MYKLTIWQQTQSIFVYVIYFHLFFICSFITHFFFIWWFDYILTQYNEGLPYYLICAFNFECTLYSLTKSASGEVVITFEKSFIGRYFFKQVVVGVVNYISEKVVSVIVRQSSWMIVDLIVRDVYLFHIRWTSPPLFINRLVSSY